MKKILLLLSFFAFQAKLFSQPSPVLNVSVPDILPRYPGGLIKMYEFINESISYTDEDKEKNVAGELIMTFVVDTAGLISRIEIKKGVSLKIDSEIKRVIQSMPAWKPGKLNGEIVNCRFSLAMMISAERQIAEPIFR